MSWQISEDPERAHGQVRYESPIYPAAYETWREIPAYQWPQDVTIRFVSIWLGTDGAKPPIWVPGPPPYAVVQPFPAVDTWATVFASHPHGYVLASAGYDRYAAPNAPHTRDRILNFPAKAGDQIGGQFGCSPVWAMASHVHLLVIVEYEK